MWCCAGGSEEGEGGGGVGVPLAGLRRHIPWTVASVRATVAIMRSWSRYAEGEKCTVVKYSCTVALSCPTRYSLQLTSHSCDPTLPYRLVSSCLSTGTDHRGVRPQKILLLVW